MGGKDAYFLFPHETKQKKNDWSKDFFIWIKSEEFFSYVTHRSEPILHLQHLVDRSRVARGFVDDRDDDFDFVEGVGEVFVVGVVFFGVFD